MRLTRGSIRSIVFSAAVLALVAAALAGCGGSDAPRPLPEIGSYGGGARWEAQPTKHPLEGIVMAIVAAPGASSNPIFAVERDIVSLNKLSFESLVTLNDELKPVPLLADRWERSGTNWVFTLRSGVHFHNGPYLTAHDVVASYHAILQAGSEGIANPYCARLQTFVTDMRALDDMTLEVSAKGVYLSLYALSFPIVQRDTIYTGTPMGTGPYWYIGRSADANLRLERNRSWWKRDVFVQSLEAVRYDSAAEAIVAFDRKEVELVLSRNPASAAGRTLRDRMTMDYSTYSYELIIPNISGNALLSDINVRRAIMYAIDRDELASTVYLDMVQKTEVPVLPGSWIYETQSAKYDYNPELALKILNDAGFRDLNGDSVLERVVDGMSQDLSLRLITYAEPGQSTRYEAIKLIEKQLSRVGIRVTTATVSRSNMMSMLNGGDFDLALVANDLSEAPDLFFMLSSQGNGNKSGYRSERMDGFLVAARTATTEEAFRAAMGRIQMEVADDLPVLGLFFRTGILQSRKDMSGLSRIREGDFLRGLEFVGVR